MKTTREQVLDLYQEDVPLKDIAAQVGTSYSNVRYHIKTSNVPRRIGRISKAERAEILRRYNQGYSPVTIGKATHHTDDTVRRVLRESGISDLRPRGAYCRALTDETERVMAELYLNGATVQEMAQHFGGAVSLVCKALDRRGVPRRGTQESRLLRGTRKWTNGRAFQGKPGWQESVQATE